MSDMYARAKKIADQYSQFRDGSTPTEQELLEWAHSLARNEAGGGNCEDLCVTLALALEAIALFSAADHAEGV